ncbi:hypothetical protein Bxe_B0045 [Paraburkholderia xenovorans LB400]|uniref:Uncharacterized protein n=1 Tax=Paraburkholderia xenovorans (strain LB400) TaxID=266265 RepID=Q13J58_PARXL|nr:hypothetical protein Bxe_B0045 [Paraburkholderia xenovorans LB400]
MQIAAVQTLIEGGNPTGNYRTRKAAIKKRQHQPCDLEPPNLIVKSASCPAYTPLCIAGYGSYVFEENRHGAVRPRGTVR